MCFENKNLFKNEKQQPIKKHETIIENKNRSEKLDINKNKKKALMKTDLNRKSNIFYYFFLK